MTFNERPTLYREVFVQPGRVLSRAEWTMPIDSAEGRHYWRVLFDLPPPQEVAGRVVLTASDWDVEFYDRDLGEFGELGEERFDPWLFLFYGGRA